MLVEAALILPVLFLVVAGILDFGVALNDRNAIRHGVREGARQGVVAEGAGIATTDELEALTRDRIGELTTVDDLEVYVRVADPYLVVCAEAQVESLTGFPVVADAVEGEVRDKAVMFIEGDGVPFGSSPGTPAWCDAQEATA
ncbi:TadE family protein [Rhabdothermincola salaria]|uniref:TadE family protein n=1 Tax=Rhabdothermincola salaria TaxID=2903142 RepID=UPI001E5536B1|nr:pilus assembly protein [Rhabdothermincola salaria]